MSECNHNYQNSSVYQTLDELEFERGIWFAAQNNDLPSVINLINKGKNVNAEDKSGYTALHYASRNGHFDMCKLLILHGANVNVLTRSGKVSPLHRSASMGHLDIFRLLIQSGASLNVIDGDGKTVLHRAVEGGHVNLIEEILKMNPDLKLLTDNRGLLPKDYANTQLVIDIFNLYE